MIAVSNSRNVKNVCICIHAVVVAVVVIIVEYLTERHV